MRPRPSVAVFTCRQTTATTGEVLGENRTMRLSGGVFTDGFTPYAVRLYRLR